MQVTALVQVTAVPEVNMIGKTQSHPIFDGSQSIHPHN